MKSSHYNAKNHKREPMFTFAIVLFLNLLKPISLLPSIEGALIKWPFILSFEIGTLLCFILPWVFITGGVLATLLLLYAIDVLFICSKIYVLTPVKCFIEVCGNLEAGFNSKRSRIDTKIFLPKF